MVSIFQKRTRIYSMYLIEYIPILFLINSFGEVFFKEVLLTNKKNFFLISLK